MNSLKQSLARRARILVAITAAAALTGYTGAWHWLPELFAHWFIQYWLVCATTSAVLFWAGDRRWGAASIALLGALSLALAPYFIRPQAVEASTNHVPLRVFQFNAAQDPTRILDWLERHAGQIDIAILVEASPEFGEGIARLQQHFPHVATQLQHGPFGMALLSKHRLAAVEKLDLIGEEFPALGAQIAMPGWVGPLHIYAIHPPPPVSGELAALRMQYLHKLAALIAARGSSPTIVAGDMNAAPWSPLFRDFAHTTDLRDSQRGHGLIATWPALTSRYSPLLGLPIDVCLHSEHLQSVARKLGPALGSDHLPVITELRLR